MEGPPYRPGISLQLHAASTAAPGASSGYTNVSPASHESKNEMKPTALLADDHAMIREAIGDLLGEMADVVGRVSDGLHLVESARRLCPDIIVTDIGMPRISGIDAMRQLKAEGSTARFIVLTVDGDARVAAAAVRAGASGYLLKQSAGEELGEAIRVVMAGGTYMTPLIVADPCSPPRRIP
jgi:DNA-binding NarL/FixJ family response regulator